MKLHFRFVLVAASVIASMAGCMLKPSIVPVRHFVLSPLPVTDASATTDQIAVRVGEVRMPSYLLRTAVALRRDTNEIEYLEDARWSERLDQCFQRTVAANLSQLLPSDRVYSTDWTGSPPMPRVLVDVQQFEVDNGGRGTLIAHWRLQSADRATSKIGTARLHRNGSAPAGNGAIIAATLSDLTAEFSRTLAQAIRESAKPRE